MKERDKNKLQILGEIGGLIFNIFFIYLFFKYFKKFTLIEKSILLTFIILTFIIETILLNSWNNIIEQILEF